MNLKTDSNPKESIPGVLKRHEEQMAGVVQKMATDAEMPDTVINGLLSARICGTKTKSKAVHKKEIAIPRSKFLCRTIATSLKKKKKKS